MAKNAIIELKADIVSLNSIKPFFPSHNHIDRQAPYMRASVFPEPLSTVLISNYINIVNQITVFVFTHQTHGAPLLSKMIILDLKVQWFNAVL